MFWKRLTGRKYCLKESVLILKQNWLCFLRTIRPKLGLQKLPGSTRPLSQTRYPARARLCTPWAAPSASGATRCRSSSPPCGQQPATALPPQASPRTLPTRSSSSLSRLPSTNRWIRASNPSLSSTSADHLTCTSTEPVLGRAAQGQRERHVLCLPAVYWRYPVYHNR